MACEKGTHGQKTLQVCYKGELGEVPSSVSAFNHKKEYPFMLRATECPQIS